ncbi:MAG: ABC transporter substrate-binding protein, partial [Phycisphaerales bacterium]
MPYWLELVAFPVMSPIHRPTYAKFASFDLATGRQRVSTDWTKPGNLVTNGPYQVVDWQYKKSMRLEPNPHHPAATSGMPASVEIVPVEDDNTSVLAFDAGGVDWLVEVRAAYKTELAAQAARYLARHRAEFDRLRADGMGWDEALCALPAPGPGERRDVHVIPSFGTDFYSFNCRPTLNGGGFNPFADARVRRAFSQAVDKAALGERVVRLGEPVARTLTPPGSIRGYEPPAGLPHDPPNARVGERVEPAAVERGPAVEAVEVGAEARDDVHVTPLAGSGGRQRAE